MSQPTESFMTAIQSFIIKVLEDAHAKGLLFVFLLFFLGAAVYVAHDLYAETNGLEKELRDCSSDRAALSEKVTMQQATITKLDAKIDALEADVARLLTHSVRRR